MSRTDTTDQQACGRCGAANPASSTRCRHCQKSLTPAPPLASPARSHPARQANGVARRWRPAPVTGTIIGTVSTHAQPGRFIPLTAWPAALAVATIVACSTLSPPGLGGGAVAAFNIMISALVGLGADLIQLALPLLLVGLFIVVGFHLILRGARGSGGPRGFGLPRIGGPVGLLGGIASLLLRLLIATAKIFIRTAVWALKQVAAPRDGVSFTVTDTTSRQRRHVVLLNPSLAIPLRSDVEIKGLTLRGVVHARSVRVLTTGHTLRPTNHAGIVITVTLLALAAVQLLAVLGVIT